MVVLGLRISVLLCCCFVWFGFDFLLMLLPLFGLGGMTAFCCRFGHTDLVFFFVVV